MSAIRTFASAQMLALPHGARRGTREAALVFVAALFLAVLIVEAVVIAAAAPGVSEIGWLYASTT
jgi:hypothetical protein